MIKPIMGNSIVKKTVLGTMMAGAVIAGGAVTKNNNSNANIQRTEISKEAAEASKTLAVTNVMDVQQVGPVRYKALDKKVIARAENEQEVVNNTKFVNDTYNTYGTFAATALLQFVLDNDVLERTTKDFQKTRDKKYERRKKNDRYLLIAQVILEKSIDFLQSIVRFVFLFESCFPF